MRRFAAMLFLAAFLPGQSVTPNPPGPMSCLVYTIRSTNSAFKAAAVTADVTLFTLNPKVKMASVYLTYPVVASDGAGAMSDVSASVGDSSSDTAYTAAYSVGEANPVADGRFQDTSLFKSTSKLARAVKAHLIATGRNFGVTAQAITAASTGNPVQLTHVGHGLLTGAHATITGATGNWTAINGSWTITRIDNDKFSIPVDSTAFGALAGSPVYAATFLISGTVTIDICTIRVP